MNTVKTKVDVSFSKKSWQPNY